MKQLIYHSTPQSFGFYKPTKFANFWGLLGLLICFCLPGRVQAQACPTISMPTEATVCAGQSSNIEAKINNRINTGNIKYKWFVNNAAFPFNENILPTGVASIPFPTSPLSIADNGDYKLRLIFSEKGCVGPDSIEAPIKITVSPSLSIDYTPKNPSINCSNTSVTVNVTPFNMSYSYKWSGGTDGVNPAQHTFNSAGQYTVTVSIGGNCTATTTITVVEDRRMPIAKAGAGASLVDAGKGVGLTLTGCNQSFFLNSAGSKNDASAAPNVIDLLTFTWTDPNGNNFKEGITAENNKIGTYILTATHTQSQCKDTAQVIVRAGAVNRPTAKITPPASKEITCTTPKLILDGSTSTPESPAATLTYAWARKLPGTNLFLIYNNPSPLPTPKPEKQDVTDAGTYRLIVTSSNGCSSLPDSIVITKNTTPPIVDINPQYNICKDIPYTLRPNTASNADTYSWKVNTGSSVPGSSLDIITTSLGNQTITLTGTRTANGCTATDNGNVIVNPPPTLKIAGPDKIKEKLAANIIITSSGNIRWSLKETINIQLPVLDTGGVTKTFSPSFMLASSRATGYVAYRIFASANNCTVDSLKEIEILPGASVFFPEIITPNGDGQNDTWNVVFPDDGDKAFHELFIFNRLGIQVYHNKDMLSPWNANGCPNGVYFYKIINTKDRSAKPYKGAITVLGRGE